MVDPLIGMTINFTATTKNDLDTPRGGLGSQVLPVAELNSDFSGIPEDGMEYLFLVRREAESQPNINRVINPYTTIEDNEVEVIAEEEPLSRPSEIWKAAFVQRFISLRERITLGPLKNSYPPNTHNSIPSAKDEGAWSVFIHGKKLNPIKTIKVETMDGVAAVLNGGIPIADSTIKKEISMTLQEAKIAALALLELDTPSPSPFPILTPSIPIPVYDPLHPPHIPSPSLLLQIDSPSIIHILSHFTNWFIERNERHEAVLNFVPSTIFAPPALRKKANSNITKTSSNSKPIIKSKPRSPLPTSSESDWILSLLLRLESLLNGDDIATLRDLARLLGTLAENSGREAEKRNLVGRNQEQKDLDESGAECRAKCWMIVAVISECWGQRDLWNWNLK